MVRATALVAATLVLLLALPGCGLVLDVDPPDPQGLDAGARIDGGLDAGVDPHEDAGGMDGAIEIDADLRRDAGSADAAIARDAIVVVDAVVAIDAASPCRSALDCADAEYCARPAGSCYGEGECRMRPIGCPDVFAPVCGCDWEEYGNACEANARGSNVMQDGDCPLPMFGTEWCALVPMAASDPGGCLRCFDDADCVGGLAPICVGSSCRAGGEGICALGPPPIGDCYDARQCRASEVCVGGVTDACLPRQGRCESP